VRTLLQRIEPSVQRQPAPAGASDAQFQKAVASSDWTGAAIAVNGVNDADFLRLLRGQPPASASRIYTAALRTMTGSARDRFTTLVPQVGNQIAYDGALAAPDWLWVGLHLNGFLDADIATRVAALIRHSANCCATRSHRPCGGCARPSLLPISRRRWGRASGARPRRR
jgi:hypothetical protein